MSTESLDGVDGREDELPRILATVVQNESLPRDWQPWFLNLNDGTNEGIRHMYKPISSVQFHPEASPGPNDTSFLFDDFMRMVTQVGTTKKPTGLINKLREMVLQ